MNCPKCGNQNTEGLSFCPKCGNSMMGEYSQEENTINAQNPPLQNIQETGNNNQKNDTSLINKLKSKKMIFIIIAVIVLIALAVLIYMKLSGNAKQNSTLFNPNQPIIVEKDGKYGYINNKGKFIIDPIYEEASKFYGNYAIVEIEANVEGSKKKLYQIIDKKGKALISTEYSSFIEYIEEYDIWVANNQLYNGSLKKISADDIEVQYEDDGYLSWKNRSEKKGGIMNFTGKITYTYKFSDDEYSIGINPSDNDESLKERYCRVSIDAEKYGIVNCDNGKVVYDYDDLYISNEGDNIFEIKKPKGYEFVSMIYIKNDKIVYKTDNKDIDLYYYSAGYIQIRDSAKPYSERYSYYDNKLDKIVKEQPTYSLKTEIVSKWEQMTGIKEFSSNYNKGIMKGEKVVLAAEWDDIDYLGLSLYQYLESNGKEYVLTSKDKKTYLINLKDGKTVVEFNASSVYDNELSTFIYYTDKSKDKEIVYNLLTGKSMQIDSSSSLSTHINYITVKEDNKLNYYNNDLELIYTK